MAVRRGGAFAEAGGLGFTDGLLCEGRWLTACGTLLKIGCAEYTSRVRADKGARRYFRGGAGAGNWLRWLPPGLTLLRAIVV